ncbi:hypothetical protein H0H81_003358 [Sphagnurus paluster]|uniref:Transmembrane protein n=1 Tax=Sphagnurus paluster TaxID=117069 RepID=A0A9P7KK84_9AGAR|nr:hypothetical protein H0H81_003358 [Sphagnurus paluster]
MPSFRTIFLVAATAFAALTSAAPVEGPSGSGVGLFARGLPSNGATDISPLNLDIPGVRRHEGSHEQVLPNLKRHNGETRSLCETLVEVDAKLRVVSDKMTATSSKANANAAVHLVAEVKVIIDAAIVNVKGLKDHPMDYILSLNGKVLTKVEVCHLLLNVINLVCAILSCAYRIAATASATVIVNVGIAFAEFLCVTFRLVDGLYVIAHPSLDSAIKIAADLKLDALVSVFNGKY